MAVTQNIPQVQSLGATVDEIWDEDLSSGHTVAGSGAKVITDNLDAKVGDVETYTQDLQTQIGTGGDGLTGIPDMALDSKQDLIKTDTGNIEVDTQAIESDTQDIQTKIGNPAGASVSADILTVDNLVDDLETRVGTPSSDVATELQQASDHVGSDTIDTKNYGLYPNGNAIGTIIFFGVPSDDDTITIDATGLTPAGESRTYTFKTALTPAINEILIGGNVSECARNLYQGIVADSTGSGTNFGAGTTAHSNVTAIRDDSGASINCYAIIGGADGDNITMSKSGTNPNVTTPYATGLDLAEAVQVTGGIANVYGIWTTIIPPNVLGSIFWSEFIIDAFGGGSTTGMLAFGYGEVGNETEFYRYPLSALLYAGALFPPQITPPFKEIPANSRVCAKYVEDAGGGTIDLFADSNRQ